MSVSAFLLVKEKIFKLLLPFLNLVFLKEILKIMKLTGIACCLNVCRLCCVCNFFEEKPGSEKATEDSSDLDYDDGWGKRLPFA